MKVIFALALLLAVVAAAPQSTPLSETEYEFLFGRFVKQFEKVYSDADEFFKRFHVFRSNMDAIRAHQADETRTFDMRMNKFGDLTNEEFTAMYNNYRPSTTRRNNAYHVDHPTTTNLPESIDWVSKGAVTPVKNQGQCGSCWSFSTTGAVEGALFLAGKGLHSLSEQELVDCSTSYGNMGCKGGEMQLGFEYIIAKGDCSEAAYPYTASDGSCKATSCTSQATITSYANVTTSSEAALQAAAAQQPVAVAVDAGGFGWQFYFGGVMTSSCGTSLDHGVLVVGYGEDNGQKYWKVKNSWGGSWGEKGFIRLARTTGATSPGECGIAMDASYPIA